MFYSASDIYNLLIADEITASEGQIAFTFLNVSVEINNNDAIGDLFQEWLAKWMNSKGIKFRKVSNSQEFPDFILDPESNQKSLLEIKTFDFNNSPSFDVANFEAYCRSLRSQAYRLNADYLIFAYELKNSKFKILNFWIKKIWQITGQSDKYPVKCQVKQDVIYNIRPVLWYSERAKFKPFSSRKEFVLALYSTLMQYPTTMNRSIDWFERVQENYLEHTGESL
ncbi:MAG: NgoBV family restriction endonuclease [Xenococcaceae cyanobacterium]